MKTILNPFAQGVTGKNTERAPVRIVAFNGDNVCAVKARQTCVALIPEFGQSCEFDYSCWGFTELGNKEEFKAALDETRVADLIVVAGRADEELPAVVRVCLEMALAEKGRADRVMIALLEAGSADTTAGRKPMEHYLRRIGLEAGMQYLAEWFDPSSSAVAEPAKEEPRKPGKTSGPYEMPSHPGDYREWGINE
jgi:hypothetical protein